jgi:uncharacterized membrane protein
MAAPPDREREEARFEQWLSHLLRAGVLLAASVVLLGGVLYLGRHGGERADRKAFHGEPPGLRNPSGIVKNALNLSGRGIIQFGLLLLVATPVARVAFSVFGFLRERDFTYVALTLVVLAVLLFSLFFGESL